MTSIKSRGILALSLFATTAASAAPVSTNYTGLFQFDQRRGQHPVF